MKPWHLLREVWASGAESLRVENGQARARWPGKAPDYIRTSFIEGKEHLGKWLQEQADVGVRYIWSTSLNELVAVAKDAAAISHVPAGIVCYTGVELEELNRINPDDLCLVHVAKKMFGGSICKG